MGRTELEPNE